MEAIKGNTARYSGFPMYMKKGFIRRQCTNDFKIQPIRKKIRELLGLKKKIQEPKKKKAPVIKKKKKKVTKKKK